MNRTLVKKRLGELSCVVAFFLILALLLQIGSLLFIPKADKIEDGTMTLIQRGYRGEPKDTLDVMFVGNSDLNHGIAPMLLWNSDGITSYASGLPAKQMWSNYGLLKDVLKKQKPKLVVMEVDNAYLMANANEKGKDPHKYKKALRSIRDTLMNFSDTHYNAGLGTLLGSLYPLIQHHGRWDSLRREDFSAQAGWQFTGRGFAFSAQQRPYTGGLDYMKPDDGIDKPGLLSAYYMKKIVRLCKKNNISLLLLENPSASSWNMKKHNWVSQFAQEHGVPFLDLNEPRHIAAMQFDWMTDSKDGGDHLNIYGAQKATRYVGAFMKTYFDLPDRRDDPAVNTRWSADAAEFLADWQACIREERENAA